MQAADDGKRLLQPRQPVQLPLFKHEVQEQHEQKDAAKRGNLRVRVVEQVGVGAGVVDAALFQGQLDGLNGVEVGGDANNQQREGDAHADDGDQDAHGEEDRLPERAHLFQDAGVHHGVVEAQADFQDAEDGAKDQRFNAAVEESNNERSGGDPKGPTKCLHEHALTSSSVDPRASVPGANGRCSRGIPQPGDLTGPPNSNYLHSRYIVLMVGTQKKFPVLSK